MFDNDINRILTLVKKAGKIDGRKKFQKIVFILQSKGVDLPEKFKYHYYGPFSSDLQLEIDELVDSKVLIEDHLENNSYSYQISQNTKFDEDSNIVDKELLINLLNKEDTKVLELTSTIYFLEKEGWSEKEFIEKKLRSLKPDLTKYISKSFDLKEKIDQMN